MGDRAISSIDLAVVGTAMHTPTPSRLAVLDGVVIGVDPDGVIARIEPMPTASGARLVGEARRVERLSSSQRLLPGMVDLHLHAPQWPQLGTGLDLPLERWLFDHTFPLEARYGDVGFADTVYGHLVPTLLAHGTTTAVYFSSVHEAATSVLAEHCARAGQRAFVGRVAMDHPGGTPEWYRDESAAAGIEASARSIDAIRSIGSSLVEAIITPRFIPACSDELLGGLGALAQQTGARIQTHCSESDWEHRDVLDRFGVTDTTALDRFGLLGPTTVLAHGDHLGDDDLDTIATAKAGVAHCPLSNAYFANAVFPARRALGRGVRVGLGTDVAGGSHPGLLAQCAIAVTASRHLEDGVDARMTADERGVPGSRLDIVAAFHLATVGGAEVLGLPVGRFEPGYSFDAFVVETERSSSGLRHWAEVDDEVRLFEKIVRLAGPDDIAAVWVAGRKVRTADPTARSTS